MGNCQAIDAATLVIQHPSGKSDKLYWPVCAGGVMKMNPGHYVALLISTTTLCPSSSSDNNRPSAAVPGSGVRVTRIKLLRPTDTLVPGQVYRLITAQEVMKVLSAKQHAKMKKEQQESVEKMMGSDLKLDNLQVGKHERQRSQKTAAAAASNSGTPRPRTWQPSLHSISEAAS